MKAINLDNHRTIIKQNFKLKEPQKITSYLVKSSAKSKVSTLKIKSLRLIHFLFGGFKWVNSNKITKVYKPLSDQLKSQLDILAKKDSLTDEEKNEAIKTKDKILDVVKLFDNTTFKKNVEGFMNVKQWEDLLTKNGIAPPLPPPAAPPPPPLGWRPPRLRAATEPEVTEPEAPSGRIKKKADEHKKEMDQKLGEGTTETLKNGLENLKKAFHPEGEDDSDTEEEVDFGTTQEPSADTTGATQVLADQAALLDNLGDITKSSKVQEMIKKAEQNNSGAVDDDGSDSDWEQEPEMD